MAKKVNEMWGAYTQLVYEAAEDTDREIYRRLLEQVRPNNNIKLEEKDVRYSFDVMQFCEDSTGIVEIKVRHKYSYEQFPDISVDTYKISKILSAMDELSATNAYVVAMYPKSDKIAIIDITCLDYTMDDVEERKANYTTIGQSQEKRKKMFIPLSIRRGKDVLGTYTYVYTYPHLMNDYVNVFKAKCCVRNIPEFIVNDVLREFSHPTCSSLL